MRIPTTTPRGAPPGPAGRRVWAGRAGRRVGRAFTLLELLVVIGIIGVLAATSVPAIRSLTQSNALAATHRQVLDDLALARQLAINGRQVVYVVFVPPTLKDHFSVVTKEPEPRRTRDLRQLTNLVTSQYTGYALFSRRSVGDQPGRQSPRYLTSWKQLPEGMMFTTNKFAVPPANWSDLVETNRPWLWAVFPFPSERSTNALLPYVAFDPRGQVYYDEGKRPKYAGEAVSVTRGSVFYERDSQGQLRTSRAPDVIETPKGNQVNVRVNWLTGRSKVDRPELR